LKVYDSREGPYCLIYLLHKKIQSNVLHMYRGGIKGAKVPQVKKERGYLEAI
jgi:hypothetical protein